MLVKARKWLALRSYRRWRRRHPASQAMVRSMVQRCRPSRWLESVPLRAIGGVIPRLRNRRRKWL
jgi:hypothetical protein